MIDPFENAIPFACDSEISNKLLNASIMWNILTEDGQTANDQDVYIILIGNGLDEIIPKYEFYRNGDSFDLSALSEAVKEWTILHFLK